MNWLKKSQMDNHELAVNLTAILYPVLKEHQKDYIEAAQTNDYSLWHKKRNEYYYSKVKELIMKFCEDNKVETYDNNLNFIINSGIVYDFLDSCNGKIFEQILLVSKKALASIIV